MQGEALTRWTIRAALACYVFVLTRELTSDQTRGDGIFRAFWTCGFVLYLAHVVAAFHFYHGWSHAAAYADTARQTKQVFGIDWGGGLYFNYLFTAVWAADVLWWWRGLGDYRRRPRWVSIVVHSLMAFMAFNATVVFESGPVRWCGIGVSIGLAILCVRRYVGRREQR